jgi:hypothetical protein
MKLAKGVTIAESGFYITRRAQRVEIESRHGDYTGDGGGWYALGNDFAERNPDELIAGPFTAEQVAAWWKEHQT